ncbi:hypothetical protein ACN4EE_05560 [Geminocystis sp. CENA526]|uniref:hypothetical protein n=1 Tax=Geminocystis sp. CENA526 TaxID=1355871 RepID=UPI003D6E63D9
MINLNQNKEKLLVLSLILALFAAWIGQMYTYLFVADDFAFAESFKNGIWDMIISAYQVTGIRRSIGFLSNVPLLGLPVDVINYFCLALHFTATLLFYQVVKLLAKSNKISFICSILFGVFPFGYGAVTWASGTYIITHFIFFLAALLILLYHAFRPIAKDWVISLVTGVLIFISCLIGEHLIFATAFIGLLALVSMNKNIQISDVKKTWVFTPFIVIIVYLLLVIVTQQGGINITDIRGNEKSVSSINLTTVISVWFYLIKNLQMFQIWTNAEAIRITINNMGWVKILIGLLILLLSVALVKIFLNLDASPKNRVSKTFNTKNRNSTYISEMWDIITIFIMMLSISGVHALAGGYSASSRHQYVPIALFLMFIGVICSKTFMIKYFQFKTFKSQLFLFLLIFIGVTTTWLVTGINKFELTRHHNLINFLAENKIEKTINLQFEPPLYFAWKSMNGTLSHSFDEEWVINLGLQYKGKEPIKLSSDRDSVKVHIIYKPNFDIYVFDKKMQ